MKTRLTIATLAALLLSVGLLATDGPLTNLMNLKTRTDENGYLLVNAGAAGATESALKPMANLRGRTDENGYLRIALAGGTATPDKICLTATTQDACLQRNGAGIFQLGNAATSTDFARLQFGGATSSFPAIKRSGATFAFRLADDSADANISAQSVTSTGTTTSPIFTTSATYRVGSNPFISATAPTIASGFGSSPSIVASNGTAAFTVNVGSGGVATSGVLTMPAATTGWSVICQNTSANTATVFVTKQTAFTTTSATIGNYDAAGAAAAWTASNVLVCSALAF